MLSSARWIPPGRGSTPAAQPRTVPSTADLRGPHCPPGFTWHLQFPDNSPSADPCLNYRLAHSWRGSIVGRSSILEAAPRQSGNCRGVRLPHSCWITQEVVSGSQRHPERCLLPTRATAYESAIAAEPGFHPGKRAPGRASPRTTLPGFVAPRSGSPAYRTRCAGRACGSS